MPQVARLLVRQSIDLGEPSIPATLHGARDQAVFRVGQRPESSAAGRRGRLPAGGDGRGPDRFEAHLRASAADAGRRPALRARGGGAGLSPAPKTRHQRIVHKIDVFLGRAEEAGRGQTFVAPIDVVLNRTWNALRPDLLFIVTERLSQIVTENNVQGAPDLGVEVLSEGTAERDLGAKLRV